MPNTVDIDVTGLSGQATVTLYEGATVSDVRSEAGISDDLAFSSGGRSIDRDAEASTPAPVASPLVTSPPEVKQGR